MWPGIIKASVVMNKVRNYYHIYFALAKSIYLVTGFRSPATPPDPAPEVLLRRPLGA
jgi:hypothetical protein